MQNSGIAEAQFRLSASAGPLFLPVRWSAIIFAVRWAADQQPADKNSGLPTSDKYKKLVTFYDKDVLPLNEIENLRK